MGIYKKHEYLLDAVTGLDLTDAELSTLEWMAGWEESTVEDICSIIKKAKESKSDGQ